MFTKCKVYVSRRKFESNGRTYLQNLLQSVIDRLKEIDIGPIKIKFS